MAYIKGDGVDKDGKMYGGVNGNNNRNCAPALSSSSWFTGCFLTSIGGFNGDTYNGYSKMSPAEQIVDELEKGIPVPSKVAYTTCFFATIRADTHTKAIQGLKDLGWQEIFRAPGSHCAYSKHQSYYRGVPKYEMVFMVCLCPPDFHIQGWKFLRDRLPKAVAATIPARDPQGK